MRSYRIITDTYAGFEVQFKPWWSPFWLQCWSRRGPANTHATIEAAEEFAVAHAHKSKVVKFLGKLPKAKS